MNFDFNLLPESKLKEAQFLIAKPVITTDLQNITSLLNQLVTLDCQAKGFPKAETKWSRVMENGNAKTVISKVLNSSCSLLSLEMREYQTNRLEFNLTRENAGQYTCIAWNSNGRAEKSIRVDYYGEYPGGETNR